MVYWLLHCLLISGLSLFFSWLFLRITLRWSYQLSLFDLPDKRKKHVGAVPRLGGIAFVPALLLSVGIVVGVDYMFEDGVLWRVLIDKKLALLGYIPLAMLILYVVGVVDDLYDLDHKIKLLAQVVSAYLLVEAGLYIDNFYGLMGLEVLESHLAIYVVNLVLITFIINAVNLIDGIDGLASALSGIALVAYGIIFFLLDMYLFAFAILGLLASVVAFFYFNVYGRLEQQRKIFMGDTGSLTLGIVLCVASFKLITIAPVQQVAPPTAWFVMVLSPLVLPCFDAARVFVVRLLSKKSPFLPDRSHIHHLLQDIGMSQRQVLVVLVLLSMLLISCNVWLSQHLDINVLLLLNVFFWIIVNRWLKYKAYRNLRLRKLAQRSGDNLGQ